MTGSGCTRGTECRPLVGAERAELARRQRAVRNAEARLSASVAWRETKGEGQPITDCGLEDKQRCLRCAIAELASYEEDLATRRHAP
jgi:hypothetical protein